jgi:dTDP-4-amino-4,6-dideoxygalactose transaminase
MIPFNRAPVLNTTAKYISETFSAHHLSGDGPFTRKCSKWMQERFGTPKALLTTSCSHALDMSAHLCGINEGDEVIMPSYTFSSTANAFLGVGAKIVFVDIRPDTMNIDETLIENAITPRTKVIVPIHYAGVSCEMDTISDIAERHGLFVVEDAAQGIMSQYKSKPLGTLSDFGCISFHETKNFSMGEGGAIYINREDYSDKAEIMREKGTNRSKFFRGQIDKYSWVEWGSSYLPSELNAAYLWSQLECAEHITSIRLLSWNHYYDSLKPLMDKGLIELPVIPAHCKHNAHLFYIKVSGLAERSDLLAYLKNNNISAVYHYIPLHSAEAGRRYTRFHGEDRYTTSESERLVRLPLYYGLSESDIDFIAEKLYAFFGH